MRAQHVAEAHHDEARASRLLQRLAHHFGEPLARAHHVGRIDRLVGRDEARTSPRPRAAAARADDMRAGDVVLHRLPGVLVFHQRHVLVGRGVKDDRRAVGCG